MARNLIRVLLAVSLTASSSSCTYPIREKIDPWSVEALNPPRIVGVTRNDGIEVDFEVPAKVTMVVAHVAGDTLYATIEGETERFPLASLDAVWVEEMYRDRLASGMIVVLVVGGALLIIGSASAVGLR